MARHCSSCGQAGHYSKTCGKARAAGTPTPELTSAATSASSTAMTASEGDGEPISPYTHRGYRQGLWLINMDKGRLAGKIKRVTRETVVYEALGGAEVESTIRDITNSNYISVDLEPVHVVRLLQTFKVKDY